MKLLTRAILTCALLGATVAGCSEEKDKVIQTGQPGPNPGGANKSGVVASLTGDDDSEVSPQLDALVQQAVARDKNDEPLDF